MLQMPASTILWAEEVFAEGNWAKHSPPPEAKAGAPPMPNNQVGAIGARNLEKFRDALFYNHEWDEQEQNSGEGFWQKPSADDRFAAAVAQMEEFEVVWQKPSADDRFAAMIAKMEESEVLDSTCSTLALCGVQGGEPLVCGRLCPGRRARRQKPRTTRTLRRRDYHEKAQIACWRASTSARNAAHIGHDDDDDYDWDNDWPERLLAMLDLQEDEAG